MQFKKWSLTVSAAITSFLWAMGVPGHAAPDEDYAESIRQVHIYSENFQKSIHE